MPSCGTAQTKYRLGAPKKPSQISGLAFGSFRAFAVPFWRSLNTITGCLLALRATLFTSYVTLIAPSGRLFGLPATHAALVVVAPPATTSELAGFGGVTGM